MNGARPDPDQLLAEVQAQEVRSHRGKLKIFFGASAGVGKTFSMLEDARRRKASGTDVVVGYVEPHGRIETERLLAGLEHLPLLVDESGVSGRSEFNLDAALARKPQLLLVDELAHTNLAGVTPAPRHEKRWQDIEEVLDAGIDVYTTVNVQHLESLSDVVGRITGAPQRETVPDHVFEAADEVELIDLPPDDLLQRLKGGKIYVPDQAQRALESFFRKGNLIALRELALRKTADRVDQAMRDYRKQEAVQQPWRTRERLLVCIGPDEQAAIMVRAGKRMADALDAEWLVVYVETPALLRLKDAERNRRIDMMRLAESLGGEAITLGGSSVVDEILEYARTRNVTRILVGKPNSRHWFELLPGRASTTARLIERAADFDVVVVGGAAFDAPPVTVAGRIDETAGAPGAGKRRWPHFAKAVGATLVATAICWLVEPVFEGPNLVMVYLLAAAVVAVRYGRYPAIITSVLNVLAFDIVFVPPRFSFAVSDAQYLLTFVIMLVVALIISNLAASVRLQAKVAGHRERRTALLYAMSRKLAVARDRKAMEHAAISHVSEVFDCTTALLLPDGAGRVVPSREKHSRDVLTTVDPGAAQWSFDHGRPAGLGTDTLAGTDVAYLPLVGAKAPQGVLAVKPRNRRRILLPEQFRLLETFAAQIAMALERADLADQAHAAELRAETEVVRNSLLASLSHDLRTPLSAVVAGAATLAERMEDMSPDERRSLATTVRRSAMNVSDHVTSVLDLVRLESGSIRLRLDWYEIDDIAATVLHRLGDRQRTRHIVMDIPSTLPALHVDGKLIEQLIENLLDNAIKYTPPETEIRLSALVKGNGVEIAVADDGPGFGNVDPEALFRKFERGSKEGTVGGIGLGLAICRAIVELHGGQIHAEERHPHGALVRVTLPLRRQPAAGSHDDD